MHTVHVCAQVIIDLAGDIVRYGGREVQRRGVAPIAAQHTDTLCRMNCSTAAHKYKQHGELVVAWQGGGSELLVPLQAGGGKLVEL